MIPNFYIMGSKTARPESRKTIFTDGDPDNTFREGIDIELSHWIPNRTNELYRADTSTEICMKFVESESPGEWDLAINNHLDVDGVLSVFTLVHSKFALQHKNTIVKAAEMGDFWSWGDESSQILFQGLTHFMNRLRLEQEDIQEIYAKCFELVFDLIENRYESEEIGEVINLLKQSEARVTSGQIIRKEVHERFVHYTISKKLAEESLEKSLKVPNFNELIKDDMWLYPQVRNKLDREKVQLVTVETEKGWYYDLWYPAYMWAETPHSWRAPGFHFSGSTNAYYYGYKPLEHAIKKLQQIEPSDGKWKLANELSPFSTIQGRNYPIILSFLNETNEPAISKITPDEVSEILSGCFINL